MSKDKINIKNIGLVGIAFILFSCVPELVQKNANNNAPDQYLASGDTMNLASTPWRTYFDDPYLTSLIDTALINNQELNIFMQEIEVLRNEVQARKGEYLPSVSLGAGASVDKVGHYTRLGALEANNEIKPGKDFPEPLGDFGIGAYAQWEVDIWKKLRTAKKAALTRYLASAEGKNFMVTELISEIAHAYYELLALDNQLNILNKNIEIQRNALEVVKLQKTATRVTELAVKRFEAQVLETKSKQYVVQQQIIETESHINLLVGRYPKTIERSIVDIEDISLTTNYIGIPSQLLDNRPDIRRAELEMRAAKMDIKVAKASFYPSLGISAGLGWQSFSITDLLKMPESLAYSLVGDITAPLLNRMAIKANYQNANARQIQTVYEYEQTLLKAFTEVYNLTNNIVNLQSSHDLLAEEVAVLDSSVTISNSLFNSARADYIEVLLTQREALESRFELIKNRTEQLHAKVAIYKALGGGWK